MTKSNGKKWLKKEITFVGKLYKQGYGRYTIAKEFLKKFGYVRSPDSIKHQLHLLSLTVERDLPRVLILDIETAPMLAYVWGTYDQNVGLNQIVSDWFILSWTAKWIDSDKIYYKDQRGKKGKALYNDKELIKPLWKMMDEADIIITQNGVKFDIKKLNTKFLENKLGKPDPFKNIDTLRLAKKYFSFTSNKLEYMAEKFNTTYKKQKHEDFSGFELWNQCLKDNIKAWKAMEKYNKYDVLATEELFLKLSIFDNTEQTQAALRSYKSKFNKIKK